MNSLKYAQDFFLKNLSSFISGSCLSEKDKLPSIFFPSIIFRKNANQLIELYNKFDIPTFVNCLSCNNVEIEKYRGRNTHVLRMIDYLSNNLSDDLINAFVHGSLGTYEEISYSDFDALVIIKDEVFSSSLRLANVAMKLNAAMCIIFDFDPLQHHGWFVFTEKDLRCYPDHYFPTELFTFAKSIFRGGSTKLNIYRQYSVRNSQRAFKSMCNNIFKKLRSHKHPKNMYQLKSLLSQFMLLPSLYVQACTGKGIYKKYSFEEVKKDFTSQEWRIMDLVSSIRENWNCELSKYKRWIMTKPNYLRKLYVKHFAPKIPDVILNNLTPQFYSDMEKLIILMQDKLKLNLSGSNFPN